MYLKQRHFLQLARVLTAPKQKEERYSAIMQGNSHFFGLIVQFLVKALNWYCRSHGFEFCSTGFLRFSFCTGSSCRHNCDAFTTIFKKIEQTFTQFPNLIDVVEFCRSTCTEWGRTFKGTKLVGTAIELKYRMKLNFTIVCTRSPQLTDFEFFPF